MSSELAVVATNLGKCYRLGESIRHDVARDWLAEGLAPAPIPGDAGIQADAGAADASVQ